MEFNPAAPSIMHVDINSCFATIEQQANPLLRGIPVVVVAYTTDRGCVLAASREAKRLGVKTGMRVNDARQLCHHLAVLPSDPDKYRAVNKQLFAIMSSYTPHISVESIDEMVVKMPNDKCQMTNVAREIKNRIRIEIGEWMTVSVGIAPNRYLAKVASGLHKPDGLDTITKDTIRTIFSTLTLEDLCGIKQGMSGRLRFAGITTPIEFLDADAQTLIRAFHSITGYHWWRRLHGFEDGVMYKALNGESQKEAQKSFGQSYAFGLSSAPGDRASLQILSQLVMKMGKRLREDGYRARGIGVSVLFSGYRHFTKRMLLDQPIWIDADFYRRMRLLLAAAPKQAIRILAIWCYELDHTGHDQQMLFEQDIRNHTLTKAVDAIQDRYGLFTVTPARMLHMEKKVLDRIAFGKC